MKRLLYLALLLAATVLLLETALQIGHAIVVFSQPPADSTAAESEATVLCIGDSYTFGVGASSPEGSYPAQLQELLIDRLGPASRAFNAGWPAQSSWDVASTFQNQLESSSPAFVSILVGTNDRWKVPSRFQPESSARKETGDPTGRWALELRTVKLVRILLGDRPTTFSDPRTGAPSALDPSESAGADQPATRARALLRQSKYTEVLELAEEALETHLEIRQELRRIELIALIRLGRRTEALRISREFEELYESHPTKSNGEFLLAALANTGQSELSLEFAKSLIETYPDIVLAWQIVGWRARDRGDTETAASAFGTILSLAPTDDRSLRAETMRSLAAVLEDGDSGRATGLLIDAMLLDGEVPRTVGTLRAALGDEAESQAATHLATLDLDDRGQALAEDLLGGLGNAISWVVSVANLEWIVETTLAAGATPLVLSYPFCPGDVSAIQSQVASTQGARWIDVCSRFERELETRPWHELFVPDGHCTEAGYAIIAELVAEAILERR